jgi:hypothetical protein
MATPEDRVTRDEFTLERRSRAGQLRHLAGKLRDGGNDVAVSVALDVLADDMDGEPFPDPDCQECGFRLPKHDRECSRYPEGSRP